MNDRRLFRIAPLAGLSVAVPILLLVTNATGGGQSGALVRLQSSTPGTVQNGNINISGTVIANKFKGNGSLLTNLPSLGLPYYGTGEDPVGLFTVENLDIGAAITGYSVTLNAGGYGLAGFADGPTGTAVYGLASDASTQSIGGYFQSLSTVGIGVWGRSSATTGENYGGYFESASTSGTGVRGRASATSGLAYGGYFETASQSGRAVFAVATANTIASTGGRFDGGGIGVIGRGLSPTGLTYGLSGFSISPEGTGVFGSATSATGFSRGGRFEVASPDGTAVLASNTATGASNQPVGSFKNLATSGNNWGVYGETMSSTGVGVAGIGAATSGGAYGVFGRSSGPTGRGVVGVTPSLSGASKGVYGETSSTEGAGISGFGTAGTGTARGVEAFSNSTAGQALYAETTATGGINYAGYFKSPSLQGFGVFVDQTGENGRGMEVRTSGRTAIGLWVKSNHTSGPNKTAIFTNQSSLGVVLEATSLATSGETYSAVAFNNSPAGTAIYAANDAQTGASVGVYSRVASLDGMGVQAHAPGQPSAYAVFAFGNTGANGTKSFVIDHPLDPANKTLRHFSSEGEQPLNVYSGNVRTDAKGFATVSLPDYFESINRDIRYQLTVVDDSDDFVLVKVSRPVQDNKFTVRSSKPGVLVSWRVEGVRNDAWVRRVGAASVIDKPEHQRGRYYDPASYGLSPEHGISYRQPAKLK